MIPKYIQVIKNDIEKCLEHIQWCKDIGDKAEDYVDLTEELHTLRECLAAAIAGQ